MKRIEFNWKEMKQKSSAFFKNLFNVAVIFTSMLVGFMAAQLYNDFKRSTKATLQPTQTLEKTSVAINERGELMIIDRSNGKYIIYDGQVGKVIFELYASKVYYDQKNP
jgi:hypothetical protein